MISKSLVKLFRSRVWPGLLAIIICAEGLQAYELPKLAPPKLDEQHVDHAQQLSKGIAQIARHAQQAIVYVSISKTIQGVPFGMVDPFEFFFGPNFRGRRQHRQQEAPKQEGVGSGFLIDLDKGYIVTNNHVIEGADEIHLKLANGKTYDGSVVGRDKNTDIAVVKINDAKYERDGLVALAMGDSEKVQVGEFVVALGAPFRLEATLSFGVVSAIGRDNLGLTKIGNFIQTDAAINPGNSGGPLVSMQGTVIGVNTAIYSPSGGYAGIGFAVPSNLAKNIALQLINSGKVSRGYLGVTLQEMDRDLAKSLDLPNNAGGALVAQVSSNSPASKAGIEPGDVITEVNNRNIKNVNQLVNTIGLQKPGSQVKLTLFRYGKKKTIAVQIGAFPDAEQLAQNGSQDGKDSNFGLTVQTLNPRLKEDFQIESDRGVVITAVAQNSAADKAGIQPGDVILTVNNKPVPTAEAFVKMANAQSRLLIRFERAGNYFFKSLF